MKVKHKIYGHENEIVDLEQKIQMKDGEVWEIQNIEFMKGEKGCGEYFFPWGKVDVKTGAKESAWKCGDKWNGERLLCPNCKKENQQ